MRRLVASWIVVLLFGGVVQSQPNGNEWIEYEPDRYYFAVKVTSPGLYQIPFSTFNFALQSIGQSISSVDPRTIDVFTRGEAQWIHVEGQTDGSFDNGDYIEFFGEGNNGWLDSLMYPSGEHTNPYYSLYNDTATYYITWNPTGTQSTKRYTTLPFTTPASNAYTYLLQEEAKPIINTYQLGKDLGSGKPSAFYHGGKGWMSNIFGYNDGITKNFPPKTFQTPNAFIDAGAPPAKVSLGLAGMNFGAPGQLSHHVKIQFRKDGGTFSTIEDAVYGAFDFQRVEVEIPATELGTSAAFDLVTELAGSLVSTTSDYSACS